MILYTEAQLQQAYNEYARNLQNGVIKLPLPTIEEFRLIYEAELEEQLFDDMEDFDD
jgi:hypothetical protein